VIYTVEFQKRGLPHVHIIFWVSTDTTEPTPEFIDSFISAQIPDPAVDPLGYAMVAEHMVHGPCGKYNPKCLCIKNGKCSKNYPKEFHETTNVDKMVLLYTCDLTMGDLLSKAALKWTIVGLFHITSSFLKNMMPILIQNGATRVFFIKYLFKYVTKGLYCSKAYLQKITSGEDTPIDEETGFRNEVKEYLDTRYIYPFDSCC
jgi:hypothetical protein